MPRKKTVSLQRIPNPDRKYQSPMVQRLINKSMLDGKKLREVIETERPDYIIPEVEAIATDTLVALEKEGYSVTPTARTSCIATFWCCCEASPPRTTRFCRSALGRDAPARESRSKSIAPEGAPTRAWVP